MTTADYLLEETEGLRALLRQKLGVRAGDFPAAVQRAGRRLPGPARRAASTLAKAMPMADHPKLRQTLDARSLEDAAVQLREYLEAIDLADRRKGAFLSLLGSIAFNLIAVAVLVVTLLVWRGLI